MPTDTRSAAYGELLKDNRNFRLLWSSQFISELGSWFSFIAELGLLRMLSDSQAAITAFLVLKTLPFLLAPLVGVFIDKLPRKSVLIASDLLRAILSLGYILALRLEAVWPIYVCVTGIAILTVVAEATRNAMIPDMVSQRGLVTANILMNSAGFIQLALGAALGGVAATLFGYEVAFMSNALSFVMSAGLIALIALGSAEMPVARPKPVGGAEAAAGPEGAGYAGFAPPVAEGQGTTNAFTFFKDDFQEGMRYIWRTPFIRAVILSNVGWAAGSGMATLIYNGLGGQKDANDKGGGDAGVAAFLTAAGIGLFIGMVLARRAWAWIDDEHKAGRFIGWTLLGQGAFFAAAGLMPSLAPMVLCVVVSRLLVGVEFGVQETLLMKALPGEFRGRFFSTDRALELTTIALSTVAGGWLLTWLSPRSVMVSSGLVSAFPGLVWLLALRFTSFRVPKEAVN